VMAGAISVPAILPSPTIPHPSVCESTQALSYLRRGIRPQAGRPRLRVTRRPACDRSRYMIGRYHYARAITSELRSPPK
jgi:hypothetical protein